jgi:hypothetical protein
MLPNHLPSRWLCQAPELNDGDRAIAQFPFIYKRELPTSWPQICSLAKDLKNYR